MKLDDQLLKPSDLPGFPDALDALDVTLALYNAVSMGKTLHGDWKTIWDKHRADSEHQEYISPGALRKIDKAIRNLSYIGDLSSIDIRKKSKVCIFLGAGASTPTPSSIPTVAQLLPELWRRARKLGREDIDRLSRWCEEKNVTNIEDLLTAAYLANFSAKNPAVSGLLNYFLFNYRGEEAKSSISLRPQRQPQPSPVDASSVAMFQETLQGLFGLLTSTMIPAPPNNGHKAITKFVKNHADTSIVTTNYDGCMDESLLDAKVPINTHIGSTDNKERNIDLVKIHGSINWTYCDSCHEVKEFDLLSLKQDFKSDRISYAVVGICKSCGGQRRPLLIPPIGLKFVMFPNLIRLWNIARERIEGADLLIVVGFSFSEADSYINKIVERSMSMNSNQRIIVCDPNRKLSESLRERYAARISGFQVERIIEAVGSAEVLLPELFEKLSTLMTGDGAKVSA